MAGSPRVLNYLTSGKNSKVEKALVFDITYWEGEKAIGYSRVYQLNAELIWDMFRELGHSRTENTTFEVRETFEEA